MKILVTGGAGFIGSHTVDSLVAEGHEVVILDNLSTGSMENVNPACNFYHLDITGDIEDIFNKEKPEVVIHLAAQIDVQISVKNPKLDADINISGTLNLLDSCIKHKVKKFIYASSAAAYGSPEYLPIDEKHPIQPISNYGISKFTPELYIQAYSKIYGLDYTILRYANAYGPRQGIKGEGGVIYIFANQFVTGKAPVIYGTGQQTRDFVFVGDIVRANLATINEGSGKIINIGTGKQISINDLVHRFNKLSGLNLKAQYKEARPADIENSVFDVNKAELILDWQAETSLDDGLEKTLNYYRAKS